jgi:3-oxosteroid 1-dehydrogenase
MSAAITAADAGLRALVVEKDDKAGGVQALSSGQIWLGATHLQSASGHRRDAREFAHYLDHLIAGTCTARPCETCSSIAATKHCAFLGERIGIPFMMVRGLPDYFYPSHRRQSRGRPIHRGQTLRRPALGEWAPRCGTVPYGVGYSFTTSSEWVAMQVQQRPIHRRLSAASIWPRMSAAPARALRLGCSKPRSIEALRCCSRVPRRSSCTRPAASRAQCSRHRAVRLTCGASRGVVLATSGYDWNADLVRAYEALPQAGSMCPPTVEGDHFRARGRDWSHSHCRARTRADPHFRRLSRAERENTRPALASHAVAGTSRTPSSSMPKGMRFCDDGFYPNVAVKVARFDGVDAGMPNWPAWLIFDDDFREKYGLLPAYPGQPIPEGAALQAANLNALARAAGIDTEGIAATVKRFNEFAATGVDLDFGRGTVPWGRIMTGDPRRIRIGTWVPLRARTFYAVKLERVIMGVPTVGLQIDTHAQVVDARGKPVPGLYAAGNSAAWSDIGGGYNSGIANMRGLLQGYVAARCMTGENQ